MYSIKRNAAVLATALTLMLAACGGGAAAPAPAAKTEPAAAEATPTSGAAAPAEPPKPTEEPPVNLGTTGPKIVVWHGWGGDYYKAIEKQFANYAQKNNVTIELLKVNDVGQKLTLAVPTGQGPDVLAWVNDQIGKNVLAQAIQPLNDFGVDEGYLASNFTETAAKAMVYDGKVYGIPESMEALTMICNSALIKADALPKTTDDLIKAAQSFNKAPDKYLFVYDAKNNAYFSAPWWLGAGTTLVTADGKTGLGTPESIAAANLIKSFTEIIPKEIDYGVADTLFKEGKAACIMNGPWAVADYQAKGLSLFLATLPTVSSSGKPARPFVGVKMLMLANKAKQAQAAVDLMKYYGSTEVQAELAKVNKQVPANKVAQDQVKSDPIVSGFIAQTALGEPLPNTEFVDAMWEPVGKTVEAIWTGAVSPDQAVKDGAALFEKKVVDLK
jgi:arabinogalactan oligomer/maltooligosaccharide transport system substrate-binding protein